MERWTYQVSSTFATKLKLHCSRPLLTHVCHSCGAGVKPGVDATVAPQIDSGERGAVRGDVWVLERVSQLF